MTADRTRQELAAALREKRTSWDPEELREIVADVAPVVERLQRQAAAEAQAETLQRMAELMAACGVSQTVERQLRAAYKQLGIEAT